MGNNNNFAENIFLKIPFKFVKSDKQGLIDCISALPLDIPVIRRDLKVQNYKTKDESVNWDAYGSESISILSNSSKLIHKHLDRMYEFFYSCNIVLSRAEARLARTVGDVPAHIDSRRSCAINYYLIQSAATVQFDGAEIITADDTCYLYNVSLKHAVHNPNKSPRIFISISLQESFLSVANKIQEKVKTHRSL